MDEVKDPHTIILRPHITEKSRNMSYGDSRTLDETKVQRSYTFIVAPDANKIEIKYAIEAIYNAGKKEKDAGISVEDVRTIKVRGKFRRVGSKSQGRRSDRKKAIVTLVRGQMLEDYGV